MIGQSHHPRQSDDADEEEVGEITIVKNEAAVENARLVFLLQEFAQIEENGQEDNTLDSIAPGKGHH